MFQNEETQKCSEEIKTVLEEENYLIYERFREQKLFTFLQISLLKNITR